MLTLKQLNSYQNFYLVGIKGVAMTSISHCLIDLGKIIQGCDVKENFVTSQQLKKIKDQQKRETIIDCGFQHDLPEKTDCVIYTSAHQGSQNPLVQQAQAREIPAYSQAEVLGAFFNSKENNIAVCGVGGKSTTSAMITWILSKIKKNPSFSVGVGRINGLDKTGQYHQDSTFFIAEADEYAANPNQKKSKIIPRFSYLKPLVTVCTNLAFDHPDIYRNFNHTKKVFKKFFKNIKSGGYLVYNHDDQNLSNLISKLKSENLNFISYGQCKTANFELLNHSCKKQNNQALIKHKNQTYTITLKIPGLFNIYNALGAVAALSPFVSIEESIQALKSFASTQRRFEFIEEKKQILYYDDYAHHPNEIISTLNALKDWHPDKRIVAAFQPHTYSRTKQLLTEFAQSFDLADQVVLTDIFASAREKKDDSISSNVLIQEIKRHNQSLSCMNVHNNKNLAKFCQNQLNPGDVLITMGAGDIYEVHKLI